MTLNQKFLIIEKELNIPKSEIITVSQLNSHIEQRLRSDSKLLKIYVIGEVSNLRKYPSGHSYFNLKDKFSLINCAIYKDNLKRIRYVPEDGKEILVLASIRVYKQVGKYCYV